MNNIPGQDNQIKNRLPRLITGLSRGELGSLGCYPASRFARVSSRSPSPPLLRGSKWQESRQKHNFKVNPGRVQ
jgi:hypothetical protein